MTNDMSVNECPVHSWSEVEYGAIREGRPSRVTIRAFLDSSFARLKLKPGDECVLGYCDSRYPGVVESIEYWTGRGR